MGAQTKFLYRARFKGRKIGAIGIFYRIDHIVGSDYPLSRDEVEGELAAKFESFAGFGSIEPYDNPQTSLEVKYWGAQ